MRTFIASVALWAAASAQASYGGNSFPYSCTPNQSCWPTHDQWSAFNSSINGRLGATVPLARVCYTDPSSPACKAVETGYLTDSTRQNVYGATENINWEVCGYSNQCLLNSFNTTMTPTQNCSLGRLSAYYVKVQEPSDVVKSLAFVRQHNLRLSLKNTGHDYSGRSTAANSLALWTQNLKNISYHATFDKYKCKSGLKNIGVLGAGIIASEAYNYFSNYSMYVVVGNVGSVGIAGGYGQGGGHGALAPSYGLGVDQAVEFDVIFANGTQATINECNNADLFYAMRGGGGGTYAVLLNYKLQLHPAVPLNTYTFEASILPSAQTKNLTNSTILLQVVTALAKNQTNWSNHRVAGFNTFTPTTISSIQILPSSNTTELQALTAQWSALLSNLPGLNITTNKYDTSQTYPEYAGKQIRKVPVGVAITAATRLIPRTLFDSSTNASNPTALVDAFLNGMQISQDSGAGKSSGTGAIYATGPANQPDNSATGVNPAWRGSLWEVVYLGIWTSADSRATREQYAKTPGSALQRLVDLTPGGGTYLNEGNVLEPDWQQSFFGSNYNRLLAIKKAYDPTNLFNCWKCVGWNGESDPFYNCYNLETDGTPTVPQVANQQPVAPVS